MITHELDNYLSDLDARESEYNREHEVSDEERHEALREICDIRDAEEIENGFEPLDRSFQQIESGHQEFESMLDALEHDYRFIL